MDIQQKELLNQAMRRLAQGDRSAFDEVFEIVWLPLLKFVRFLGVTQPEVEDICQEVILKIFAQIGDYDESLDGFRWIVTVARYEVLTHRKRIRRRSETPIDESVMAVPAKEMSIDDLLDTQQISENMRRVINELPPLDRETVLDFLSELEPKIPRSVTFRKRLERAIARLKISWRETYG